VVCGGLILQLPQLHMVNSLCSSGHMTQVHCGELIFRILSLCLMQSHIACEVRIEFCNELLTVLSGLKQKVPPTPKVYFICKRFWYCAVLLFLNDGG
jgi:hypothetical protein